MSATADVLPDSRLIDPKGCVKVDIEGFDFLGRPKTYRLHMEPFFCINCGKKRGYVPQEIMSFVSFMCLPCAESLGEYAALWDTPDDAFCRVVEHEMIKKFGRVLTQVELEQAVIQGRLGSALEKLERESPYVVWRD